MLGVLILVLSAASGGLAVTARFTESSVTSDVTVQIDRQFVVPRFESINQTDIRESKGSQSLLRTQNGATLRVIEENVTADSITVTVPIENNGTNRRTTRLSVESSTTPFRIDTETISQSFANNSTFARTVNHTLASDTDAFVELPSTVGDEPRAVNVTVSYNKTPASPLTTAFRLSPTEGRIDVQPSDSFDEGGGNSSGDSGGSGGGSGTSSTDPFSPAASTVVTDGLKIINPNGTDPGTILISRDDVKALGSSIDLDGDGRFEQPFVNSSGALKTVEAKNTSTGVQIRNETTLVPASSPNSPRSSKTVMAAGRFDGSETSIFYASTNEEIVRVSASGSIKTVTTEQSKAVSGIGDVDGDGVDELAFTDGSANLKYLNPGGSVEGFGTGAGSNNGTGVDGLLNVDGDTAQEQLFVGGSNNINAIDANDDGSPTKLTSNGQATKSPLTAADTDRDGQKEVLFVSTSSQRLKYVDNVGSENDIKPVVNASGQPVTGFTETGLASAAAVSSSGGGGSGGSGTEAAVSPVEAQTAVFNQKNPDKLRSVRPNTNQKNQSNQEFGTNIQTKSLGPQTQLFGDSQTEIPFIGNNKRLKAVNQSGNVRTLLNGSENGGVDLREGVRLGVADVDSDGRTAVIFSDNNGRIRRYEPETGELKTVLSTNGVDAHSIGGLADFDNDGSRDELVFTDANNIVRILQTDTGTVETTGFETKNKIKIGSPVVDSGSVKLPAVNANESVVLVNRTGGTRTLTTEGQPTGGLATVDIDDDNTTEILFANGNNNNRINVVELNGDTRKLTSTPNNVQADGNTGVS